MLPGTRICSSSQFWIDTLARSAEVRGVFVCSVGLTAIPGRFLLHPASKRSKHPLGGSHDSISLVVPDSNRQHLTELLPHCTCLCSMTAEVSVAPTFAQMQLQF